MAGKFAAGIFDELLKGKTRISKPALKRACTDADLFRDILQRRPLPGH
jgi:hypothetical protein